MPTEPRDPSFPSTHWSLVQRVKDGDDKDSGLAMEAICKSYWYPIYAFLRRIGHAPSDAEDLTQGFFHRLIDEKSLLTANSDLGRLRSFLLGVLKRLLSDHTRHNATLKRGGGHADLSIDETDAEDRYKLEPSDLESPDKLFDRAWAHGILEHAAVKLRVAFEEGDNGEAFHHLQEFLPQGDNATSYRKVAKRMGVNENSVRLMVHRMRQRYRKCIEEEVAQTVTDPGEVEAEIEHLLAAVGT
jgi:RNA polymerase sigma factor (sigma-70 family)